MTPRMNQGILIADDHDVVRRGIHALLADSEYCIVDEAATLAELASIAQTTTATAVLLDVRFPDGDGLNAVARLKIDRPGLPIVMFSAYENPNFIARAIALGANGYVSKAATRERLLESIHLAITGEHTWSREELRRVSGSLAAGPASYDIEAPLTKRENEVLRHLAQGRTNKQIAESLQISYETVKEHVQHVLRKVGVSDRTQVAVWAVRSGSV
jgi:DNA-binding NarL/FixJ family response regulator